MILHHLLQPLRLIIRIIHIIIIIPHGPICIVRIIIDQLLLSFRCWLHSVMVLTIHPPAMPVIVCLIERHLKTSIVFKYTHSIKIGSYDNVPQCHFQATTERSFSIFGKLFYPLHEEPLSSLLPCLILIEQHRVKSPRN